MSISRNEIEAKVNKHDFSSIDCKLISAYEEAVGITPEECLVSWFGDYNMHVTKYEATPEQLQKRLISALEAIGMEYDDYLISDLPKGYTSDIRKQIVERMELLNNSIVTQRLFVDMDGVVAVFQPVDRLETLYEYGYFANLKPMEKVVEAIRQIHTNHPEIEVHILSSYLSDSPHALIEKNQWLDEHLPGIDAAHRIFVPCGESKADAIEDIRPTDFLLDDYTTNLVQWEPPARGIKLLNGINHTGGTWQGDRVSIMHTPEMLAAKIVTIIKGHARVYDIPPQEAVVKEQLAKIAATLIQEGTELTESGNWIISFGEIEERFGFKVSPDNKVGKMLMDVFSAAKEVADVIIDNVGIDLDFYLGFCQNFMDAHEYSILQLKEGDENRYRRFISMADLQRSGEYPDARNYRLVYSGKMEEGDSLESLYQQFNLALPEGFTGHSLSVSDVVVIKNDNGMMAYYVDTPGFSEVPGFAAQVDQLGYQLDDELEL